MDLSRLRRGEAIASISGLALIVVMFLPWWAEPDVGGVPLGEIPGVETSFNAWQAAAFNDVIWFVTGLAAVVLGALAASQNRPDLPIAGSAIITGLGMIALVLIVVRLIEPPGNLEREVGVWLGLLAILGIVFGGWTAMQDEGTGFRDQAERFEREMSEDDQPPPPGDEGGAGKQAAPGEASPTEPPDSPAEGGRTK